MEAMVGIDTEPPSSTSHEIEEIFGKRGGNSSGQKDIAIQVENDVSASLEKIAEGDKRINFIPRVPEILREGANGAYDPQVISIGPYHWGKPWLQATETHKRQILADLLKRNPERGLRDYIKAIEALEPRLRSCYDKDIFHKMTSKDFVEIMLVDGCFLVEFGLQNLEMVRINSEANKQVKKQEFGLQNLERGRINSGANKQVKKQGQSPLMNDWNLLQCDILLLFENQLPFFLLQCIYDIATKNLSCPCPSSFIQVALEFIGSADSKLSRGELSTPIMLKFQLPKTIHHYLHLYHSVYVHVRQPTFDAPPDESSCSRMTRACMRLCQKVTSDVFATSAEAATGRRRRRTIPSASELHELGIKFKVSKSPKQYHIKFHRGVMEIARLFVGYRTSITTLNLIAFERFDFEAEPCLIAFYKFFDLLVNTSDDVALLRRYDIIHHQMGSDEELALFFNQLTKGILNDRSPRTIKLYKKVNEYCNIKRHRWRASLTRDYCSSPWSTLGVVVGFILLALTFVQSYMSLHSYFRPPHS